MRTYPLEHDEQSGLFLWASWSFSAMPEHYGDCQLFEMKQFYGTIAGLCFGLAIGIAFAWAVQISEDREQEMLGAELNAYRNAVIWGGGFYE